MPITTMSWNQNVAYGPRAARYEINPVGGLYEVWATIDGRPLKITTTPMMRDDAMLAAQRHAETLSEKFEHENDSINGASDRPRVPFETRQR